MKVTLSLFICFISITAFSQSASNRYKTDTLKKGDTIFVKHSFGFAIYYQHPIVYADYRVFQIDTLFIKKPD